VGGALLSLAAGALTALSPCAFMALPLIVGSALQEGALAPAAVAAGMTASFTVVGLLLAATGSALGLGEESLRHGAAALMAVSGLVLLSERLSERAALAASPLASAAARLSRLSPVRGLCGQFLTGALLGAVWSPCSGPTLGAAVGLAAQAGGFWRAGILMAAFGAGASAPLLAVAYGARGGLPRMTALRAGKFGKAAFGGVLVAAGLLVLAGWDRSLEAAVLGRLPAWWLDLTTRY
jgi:cytochrome c biogenesis protein CcdA